MSLFWDFVWAMEWIVVPWCLLDCATVVVWAEYRQVERGDTSGYR